MKVQLFLYLLIPFVPFSLNAQLCTGNAGDPVVNVTFDNYRAPLPKSATTFSYVASCPFDTNSYTIQNLIFGCGEDKNARSWHLLAGDHTGDMNGQYMLVNASWALGVSHPPAVVHIDTANSLCGDTRYQYSAWIANVMSKLACGGNPVLPNLTLTVSTLSGVTLATTNTGPLPVLDSRIWKEYGLSFITPANVNSVVLALTIEAERGCGNAFVVDDITFKMCGPVATATIDGKTEPAKVCADYTDPFVLNGNYAAGLKDPVVQWQNSIDSGKTWKDMPGITSTTYQIPHRSIGNIVYRMAVAERKNINSLHCRIVSNSIYTEVHPLPPHQTLQSVVGCLSKDLVLPPSDPSALSIQWVGPNGYNSTAPKAILSDIKYADTGLYVLKQAFYFGCTSTDTISLKVFPSTTISTQLSYSMCEGSSIQLAATGSGIFKWSPATFLSNDTIFNPFASPRDSTSYKVTVTNNYGCRDSADVKINVFRNPVVNAGPDRTIVVGDTIVLNGAVKGTSIRYAWSPATFLDNPLAITPKVFPPINTRYTLSATSEVGCGTAISDALVTVYKDIYVPTAFTPNADGKNDRFKVFAADGYKLIRFTVYNRWGQIVFSAKDSSEGWDGNLDNKPQSADTYVYYLEIETNKQKKIIKKGTITLIR